MNLCEVSMVVTRLCGSDAGRKEKLTSMKTLPKLYTRATFAITIFEASFPWHKSPPLSVFEGAAPSPYLACKSSLRMHTERAVYYVCSRRYWLLPSPASQVLMDRNELEAAQPQPELEIE